VTVRRIAVDLGASTTTLALSDGETSSTSSAVLSASGRTEVGDLAFRLGRTHPDALIETPIAQLHRHGELAALPLKRLYATACDRAGGRLEAEELWLTHPPSWSPDQVAELEQAVRSVGIDVSTTYTLAEPIAALHRHLRDAPVRTGTCLAVVDLGGLSCDASVLRYDDAGDVAVLAHRGSPAFSGDVVDRKIADWVLAQLRRRGDEALADLLEKAPGDLLALRRQAREAKEALSELSSSPILVETGPRTSAVELTRGELTELLAPELDQLTTLLADSIADAEVTPSVLVAVGGGSRTPAVAEALRRASGLLPSQLDKPELAVAEGALLAPRPTAVAVSSVPCSVSAEGPRDELAQAVSAEVIRLADSVEAVLGAQVTPLAERLRAEARRVPRVAVVGRVKSGKSTLVNAVIGRRAAPTDDRECTLIPTRYEYGAPERCEVVPLDGEPFVLPLDDGGLPRDLRLTPEQIDYATVYLSADALRDFTLVDTPGLSSTTQVSQESARRHLLGDRQGENADALIYVFRQTQFADDSAALRELAVSRGAIGVLSFADTFSTPWGNDDPMELAANEARVIADRTPEFSTVTPLAARLAEAADAGLIREADAVELAALSSVSDFDLELGLVDDPESAHRLSALLGEYGLRHGRVPAGSGASALRHWARTASNIDSLTEALTSRSIGRYHHLIAHRSLSLLEQHAREAASIEALSAVQSARQLPHLHGVIELEASIRLADVDPDHPLLAELALHLDARNDRQRVGLDGTAGADDVHRRALAAGSQARARATLAFSPVEEFALRTLTRSYALIAERSKAVL